MSRSHLVGRHIVSAAQFTRGDLRLIFRTARRMRDIVKSGKASDILAGKVMACLFYEASTRTSSSFTAAMQRLGGQVIPITNVQYSSVTKGESLHDTVRTLEAYADVVVLRHPERGSAAKATEVMHKPLINAGDGDGEHPTQALLDAFTLREELGSLRDIRVTLLGDLKYGRTVHALVHLLRLYGAHLHCVSPPELALPPELVAKLVAAGVDICQGEDLIKVLPKTDALYVTRLQKERMSEASYAKHKDGYVITPELMLLAKRRMALLHPFPRVNEITPAVDTDPRAAYFRQMENGLYVRMALLALVLGRI